MSKHANIQIPVEQLESSVAQLIDRAASGEELMFTRDGVPVARLLATEHSEEQAASRPVSTSKSRRRLGWGKDMIKYISPDFDAPMEFRE